MKLFAVPYPYVPAACLVLPDTAPSGLEGFASGDLDEARTEERRVAG
jgi:hypothetical protein